MDSGLQGYEALRRRIAAIKGPVLGKAVMQTLAMAAVREAKLLEAPHRKTGNLGRTIHAADVTDSSARVIASANYAVFLEKGTRAHEITPRVARVLAWAGGSSGGAFRRLTGSPRKGTPSSAMTFAMRVHHPGTKAYPYLKPGAEKAIASSGLADRIVSAWNDAA